MTQPIDRWLLGLGLEKYGDAFAAHDIGPDVLAALTEAHLREIGVSVGDRLRLLQAIAALAATRGDGRVPPANGSQPVASSRRPEPAAPPAREAERRQLTVMFCDLVGSTELSSRFDPEDMQQIIGAYHDACAKAVTAFNGYVAKYMGDGVLAYFGYPQAHENDAENAVRAGLEVVEAVSGLRPAAGIDCNLSLAVRVGIATGLVVVGDMVGEGAAEEAGVVGETPNVAARLQALAEKDQVVIAPLTQELVGSAFSYEDLGPRPLKGIAQPVRAWRVIREVDADHHDAMSTRVGEVPLVGRQEELGLLLRCWGHSKQGRGQVVLIRGDAGIGKSRLISALRDRLAGEDYLWIAVRCSAYHANSTLYPVIEHLKRALRWEPEDSEGGKLEKLETALRAQSPAPAEAVPLIADLLSLPLPAGRYPALDLSAKQRRERTLDVLTGWLLAEAERRPVLQVWEDVHWADPTTLELLELYIAQSPTVSMMNLLTFRPDFAVSGAGRSHVTPITLNRLERPEVEAIIAHQAGGRAVPPEVVEHIVAKADGVPLYAEELTRTILESEYLSREADRFALRGSLADLPIPATLQDTLMARLDRLPGLRELAQVGAVLGREFAYEMLQALVEVQEPALRDGLGQLVDAELLYQRGRAPRAKYVFKHALIQDAAYGSLLKRTRQHHHQQVARLLEEGFSESVEAHPELVAHHHTEAGNTERAVHFWRLAGERARSKSANVEAVTYLGNAVALMQKLPESSDRARQELALQVALGNANIVAKGHGAAGAEAAFTRALTLCGQLGDASELVSTLFGLWRFFVVARPLDRTDEIARRLHRLAAEKHDTESQVIAHYALGYTALCRGRLADANANLAEGISRYRPAQRGAAVYQAGQDPGVACYAYLGMTEWLRGHPQAAQARIEESIALAEQIDDPFSLAYALCFPGLIVAEESGVHDASRLQRGLTLARSRGFALWEAFAEVHAAHAQVRDSVTDSALDRLRARVAAIPQMGVHINTPYFVTLYAKACLDARRFDEGLRVLADAQTSIDARGEYWWAAEVARLRGELLLARSAVNSQEALGCFEQALAIAGEQSARSLELRAALGLARHWRDHDNRPHAIQVLGRCCEAFADGFDTTDLRAARALLEAMQ